MLDTEYCEWCSDEYNEQESDADDPGRFCGSGCQELAEAENVSDLFPGW